MAPLMNAYGNSCPSPYRLHIGVFFGSLHGTLNHLLLTDRLWLQRLTGEGDHPNRLDAILYEGLNRVQSSRRLERECQRNIELVWLTGRLMPDFKTSRFPE